MLFIKCLYWEKQSSEPFRFSLSLTHKHPHLLHTNTHTHTASIFTHTYTHTHAHTHQAYAHRHTQYTHTHIYTYAKHTHIQSTHTCRCTQKHNINTSREAHREHRGGRDRERAREWVREIERQWQKQLSEQHLFWEKVDYSGRKICSYISFLLHQNKNIILGVHEAILKYTMPDFLERRERRKKILLNKPLNVCLNHILKNVCYLRVQTRVNSGHYQNI